MRTRRSQVQQHAEDGCGWVQVESVGGVCRRGKCRGHCTSTAQTIFNGERRCEKQIRGSLASIPLANKAIHATVLHAFVRQGRSARREALSAQKWLHVTACEQSTHGGWHHQKTEFVRCQIASVRCHIASLVVLVSSLMIRLWGSGPGWGWGSGCGGGTGEGRQGVGSGGSSSSKEGKRGGLQGWFSHSHVCSHQLTPAKSLGLAGICEFVPPPGAAVSPAQRSHRVTVVRTAVTWVGRGVRGSTTGGSAAEQ